MEKSFLNNSFITLTRQLSSIVIGFLLISILARFLGDDGLGRYTLITLLPIMLMTFLNLGINSSTIFYISKDEVDIHTAFKNNFVYGLSLALVGIIIGAIVILFFSNVFKDVEPIYLSLSLIALPFMILNIFFQTIFQGMQNFKVYNSALLLTQTFTLLLLCLFVIIMNLDLLGALIAFIVGHSLTFIFNVWTLISKFGASFRKGKLSKDYLFKSVSYGIKAHVSNMMTFLNYRIDILLLGFYLNPTAVGFYTLAVNIGERLSIFSQSLSTVLLPKIASLTDELERNKLTAMISRNMLFFMVVGGILVVLLSEPIIWIFGGRDYNPSIVLLQLVVPGVVFLAIEKLLSNDIAGRGRPELNMYLSFFNVTFNVILNLILIPIYGVVGAAVSTSITYIISFFVKSVIYKHVTGEHYRNFLFIRKQDFLNYRKLYLKVRHR
jgi:O-antigen/teichoic acid export membrane protein